MVTLIYAPQMSRLSSLWAFLQKFRTPRSPPMVRPPRRKLETAAIQSTCRDCVSSHVQHSTCHSATSRLISINLTVRLQAYSCATISWYYAVAWGTCSPSCSMTAAKAVEDRLTLFICRETPGYLHRKAIDWSAGVALAYRATRYGLARC